jgi:hypothetical protein
MTFGRNSEPEQVDEQQAAEVATITDKALLAQFAEMAVMIPADPGGGTEDILRKILQAETWDQLDEPWQTSSVDDILGLRLKLTHATRRPSTYGQGLGVFLICHLVDPRNGKEYVKTTGSIAVTGQVAALYAKGWMPALVEWCRAERPSQNGYYPQHLRVHDTFAASNGNAS